MENLNTTQKGQYAELMVELAATEKGFIVSRPTTNARYDLIIDDGKNYIVFRLNTLVDSQNTEEVKKHQMPLL